MKKISVWSVVLGLLLCACTTSSPSTPVVTATPAVAQPTATTTGVINVTNATPQPNLSSWKTYTSSKYGFTFKYDPRAQLTESNDQIRVQFLRRPDKPKGDGMFVTYTIDPNPSRKSLAQYVQEKISEFNPGEVIPGSPEAINFAKTPSLRILANKGKLVNRYYVQNPNTLAIIQMSDESEDPEAHGFTSLAFLEISSIEFK